MGTSIEDFERHVRAVAEDAANGVFPNESLRDLIDASADLIADTDVTRMRQAASRLAGFMRVVLDAPPPAGTDGLLLLGSQGGPGDLRDLSVLAAKDVASVPATAVTAVGDWREPTAHIVGVLLRQLRHVALATEAAHATRAESDRRTTLDTRVLSLLAGSDLPVRSGDVARRLDVSAAQASRSLRRLVVQGRAAETPASGDDARARWFRATSEAAATAIAEPSRPPSAMASNPRRRTVGRDGHHSPTPIGQKETLMAKAQNPNDRHVVPAEGGGWNVEKPGASRASAHTDTQAQAITRARDIIHNAGGGELLVHGRDGEIRAKDTVAPGNDPYPPAG